MVANAVKIDSNGRIVVVGTARDVTNTDTEIAIARINTDGTLDTGFSSDGLLVIDYGTNTTDIGTALDVVGTEIFAAGTLGTASRDYIVVNVLNNGTLDTTFDIDGKVLITNGFDEILGGIDAVSASEIYLAGTTINAGVKDWFLAKLNSNGALFSGFNGTGKLQVSYPGSSLEEAYTIAVDGAGRIVVGGTTTTTAGTFAIGRFLSTGVPDITFSTDGFNSSQPYSFSSQINGKSLVFDSNNNIILGGDVVNTDPAGTNALDHDFGCRRFDGLTGGLLDFCTLADFNGLESDDFGNAVARDPITGKIYIAGQVIVGGFTDVGIARYNFPL